jgi:hypothetical protein
MSENKKNNPFMGEELEKIMKEAIMNRQELQVIPFVTYEIKLPTSDDIPENGEIEQPLTWAAMSCELAEKETAIRIQIRPDIVKETLLAALQNMFTMIENNHENLQCRVLNDVIKADEELKKAH